MLTNPVTVWKQQYSKWRAGLKGGPCKTSQPVHYKWLTGLFVHWLSVYQKFPLSAWTGASIYPQMLHYFLCNMTWKWLRISGFLYLYQLSVYHQGPLDPILVFFFFNFIYLFILFFKFMAVLGLRLCARAFSSCGKWGPLFIAVRGPLTITASLVAEHRLQTCRLSNWDSRA